MIFGWKDNNGTTVINDIMAYKLSFKLETKRSEVRSKYHRSVIESPITYLGQNENGR